ncbi:hypothetical protein DPMN_184135 [Dreissena polymorpha]|uniref:Uncharacterized protein n=1 Tax=Dreissena polymorpha TaxID=45954 RepID=A0A9D4I658_DREPO|nr:hypothetical protein DPMN_184135 [Dreissena polymorpha]
MLLRSETTNIAAVLKSLLKSLPQTLHDGVSVLKASMFLQVCNGCLPTKNKPMLERVKDNVMSDRLVGLTPFNIYRKKLAGIEENKIAASFKDTRSHPVPERLTDVYNTEKRHSFQSGQWSSVHACVPELKQQGILLLYHQPSSQTDAPEADKLFTLCLSNHTALQSARRNQHVLGIDGKHGLQDDGACVTTCVTQHHDGFGCPTAISIINRENTDSILLTLQAIIENVPCDSAECTHYFTYLGIPDQRGQSSR